MLLWLEEDKGRDRTIALLMGMVADTRVCQVTK